MFPVIKAECKNLSFIWVGSFVFDKMGGAETKLNFRKAVVELTTKTQVFLNSIFQWIYMNIIYVYFLYSIPVDLNTNFFGIFPSLSVVLAELTSVKYLVPEWKYKPSLL